MKLKNPDWKIAIMLVSKRKTFVELGNIMLTEHGPEACQRGYLTTDPEWVGRYALQYGDIRPDGTIN